MLLNVQGSDKREDDSSCPEHGGNVADTSTTQVLEEHDETHAKITSFQVGFRSPHLFPCPIRNMLMVSMADFRMVAKSTTLLAKHNHI